MPCRVCPFFCWCWMLCVRKGYLLCVHSTLENIIYLFQVRKVYQKKYSCAAEKRMNEGTLTNQQSLWTQKNNGTAICLSCCLFLFLLVKLTSPRHCWRGGRKIYVWMFRFWITSPTHNLFLSPINMYRGSEISRREGYHEFEILPHGVTTPLWSVLTMSHNHEAHEPRSHTKPHEATRSPRSHTSHTNFHVNFQISAHGL